MYTMLSLFFIVSCYAGDFTNHIWDKSYNINNVLSPLCATTNAQVINFDVYSTLPNTTSLRNQLQRAYTVFNNIDCNNVRLNIQNWYNASCNNTSCILNTNNRICFSDKVAKSSFTEYCVADDNTSIMNFVTSINSFLARGESTIYNILLREFGYLNLLNYSSANALLSNVKAKVTNRINRDRIINIVFPILNTTNRFNNLLIELNNILSLSKTMCSSNNTT